MSTSPTDPTTREDRGLTLILGAVAAEVAIIGQTLGLQRQGARWRGVVEGERAQLRLYGVGAAHAGPTARHLIEQLHPRRLIVVGLAGGLDPALAYAQTVVPKAVTGSEGTFTLGEIPRLTENPRKRKPLLYSAPSVLETAKAKADCFAESGAAIVDMETATIATIAAKARLPLHVIRVVSDPANVNLPPNLAALVDADGAVHLKSVGRLLLRNPLSIPQLWKLGRAMPRAAEEVAQQVRTWIAET